MIDRVEGGIEPALSLVNLFQKTRVRLPVDQLTKLPGWCSCEKAVLMYDWVVTNKPKRCVEIGVYGGRSLVPIALALAYLEQGMVWGIDPYSAAVVEEDPDHVAGNPGWRQEDLDLAFSAALGAIVELKLARYVRLLCGHSAEVSRCFVGWKIGMLHIDGTHSVHQTMNDVANYVPRVEHGGTVWIDDLRLPGPAEAVRTLDKELKVLFDHPEYRVYQRDR